jgi:hypothetical protein
MPNLPNQQPNAVIHLNECLKHWSYSNLDAARERATADNGYDSQAACTLLQSRFMCQLGHPAHPSQLVATEAACLNMNCVVIVGTGAGKIVPIMLVLLMDWSSLLSLSLC